MSKRADRPADPVARKTAARNRPTSTRPQRTVEGIGGLEGFEHWKLPSLDFPSFRLSLVAKIMDRLSFRQLAGLGNLSFAEWRVLSRLAISRGGLTVRQIAERAWVDRAEVSRAAAALEARGLTARRDNPNDRRMPTLYVTEEGLALYGPIMRARRRFHAAVIADLGEEERRQLDELLLKLARRLLRMSADETF
jgi:DNA-binding MarR family transcriptional regulator